MTTLWLDHVNLVTPRLAETVRFYEQAFGLAPGFYPPELSTGAWLYDSAGRPVIHMQEVTPETHAAMRDHSRARRGAAGPLPDFDQLRGSGALDHVALGADDFDGIAANLDRLGVPFQTRELPSAGVRQIFACDPNGILIEVNCRAPA